MTLPYRVHLLLGTSMPHRGVFALCPHMSVIIAVHTTSGDGSFTHQLHAFVSHFPSFPPIVPHFSSNTWLGTTTTLPLVVYKTYVFCAAHAELPPFFQQKTKIFLQQSPFPPIFPHFTYLANTLPANFQGREGSGPRFRTLDCFCGKCSSIVEIRITRFLLA